MDGIQILALWSTIGILLIVLFLKLTRLETLMSDKFSYMLSSIVIGTTLGAAMIFIWVMVGIYFLQGGTLAELREYSRSKYEEGDR